MDIMDMVFILGAPDPEMIEIESVIRSCGVSFLHAQVGGLRVHSGNAYNADACNIDIDTGILWVECGDRSICRKGDVIIDHHHNGDPGFDALPSMYMEGSSLGQVLGLLGIDPTPLQRIIAAADHCPLAAYQGQCPGVDPIELGAWRLNCRASHQGRILADVMRDVDRAIAKLHQAELFEGMKIRDMRGRFVPELPEAGLRSGLAYIAGPLPNKGGRKKYVVGAADRRTIEHWMDWADAQEWEIYGSPMRGYAGGFPPEGKLI